jgi:hypothetical protein
LRFRKLVERLKHPRPLVCFGRPCRRIGRLSIRLERSGGAKSLTPKLALRTQSACLAHDDPIQPCGGPGLASESILRDVGQEEGSLQGILGVARVAGDPERHAKQASRAGAI